MSTKKKIKQPPDHLEDDPSDDNSMSDDSTTDHSLKDTASTESNSDDLVKRETRAVNSSKILVYTVLLVTGVVLGIAMYSFLSDNEEDDFKTQFNFFAKSVNHSSDIKANRKFSSLRGLSKSITSYSMSAGLAWPFVSFPDFEIQTSEVSNLSEAELIAFAPIVPREEKSNWEAFAVNNQGWIQEGLEIQGLGDVPPGDIADSLYPFSGEADTTQDPEVFVPLWQIGKAPTNSSIVMMDLNTHPSFKRIFSDVFDIEHVLLSGVFDLDFLIEFSTDADDRVNQPRSCIITPVFDTFQDDASVVGFVIAVLPWDKYFTNILPEGTDGVVVNVKDSCGSEFTYELFGPRVEYVGRGGQNNKFAGTRQTSSFAETARYGGEVSAAHCDYTLNIYPSAKFRDSFDTIGPTLIPLILGGIFLFTTAVFAAYDHLVERRQSKILATAKRTTDIIGSLFPKEVGKRLIEEAEKTDQGRNGYTSETKSQLKSFLGETSAVETGESAFKTKPIADLFPETTIMFADIVGFTAWSSMREPSQVFTLLETIYHEFDVIARRRRVFKVETIGDCYVAVAGLPDPRKDHHVVMARFARDCLYKFLKSIKYLEMSLGPDTSDLGLRVGLNSGPVTAGVLRGERARFQLFGDTMNTTARVESTGMKNKIHMSQETADLLKGSGKGHWVTARDKLVTAKGKGDMQTYFLEIKGDSAKSTASGTSQSSQSDDMEDVQVNNVAIAVPQTENGVASKEKVMKPISEKQYRLVNWNADIMARLLKEVVALREASGSEAASEEKLKALEEIKLRRKTLVIEEVEEIVTLPVFDANVKKNQEDLENIDLGEVAVKQLRDYVATISVMYQDNPFHNFEHASHVAMSTVKLLARIVAPDQDDADEDADDAGKNLHDHTYGITSDPLTQFACVFAALIHDVDHPGVPNSQLIKEGTRVASVYKNKSVAEQNSVDLAWELLMDDAYTELRRCIYTTEVEFNRFRQLIVNAVMATDIMDKDLKAVRNKIWDNAFDETHQENCEADTINRKATIVITHLIQASDVAHTMQHWHIYRKWNTRLFSELHKAYTEGRSDTNPAENWYKGEMGFFDFYIIPLAKKLKECGVFGVSSEEYLNYAKQNRREWESKGQQIVEEMVLSLHYKDPKDPQLSGKPMALPNSPVQKNDAARPA